MSLSRTSVVIADDHRPFLVALHKILEPDFDVVGTATSGPDLVELAHRLDPDLLLIDLEMPGMGGLEAIAECRRLGVHGAVVMVTVSAEAGLAEAALREGALGYVTKDRLSKDLRRAIERALRGVTFVSPLNEGD